MTVALPLFQNSLELPDSFAPLFVLKRGKDRITFCKAYIRPLLGWVFLAIALLPAAGLHGQCPTIEAIMVDACGTEQSNEFIIINSGANGFNVSDLQVDFDINNNIIGPENNDINMGGAPCGLQPGNIGMVNGCTNLIAAGPGTVIPPNSYVILQTSADVNASYNFTSVCAEQPCVYVIRSTCARSAGAFSNAGSGLRTTAISLNGGCTSAYTYDRSGLSGANGDYFIPPGTYGNAGCTAPPVTFGSPPPQINPMANVTICGTSYVLPPITGTNLSGNQAYYTGTNGTGTSYLPGATVTAAGTYYLFDGAPGCSDQESFVLTLQNPVTPTLTPIGPFCTNDGPVNLPGTQSGVNGDWSGMGVSSNVFSPAVAGSGTVTLTFTPWPGQCALPASLSVTVTQTPTANSTTLVECGVGGQGTFNLVAANNLINNLPGNTVNWFLDPNGSLPVPNPAAHTATNGTIVYAIVTNGNCSSVPGAVLLNVTTATAPAITGIPMSICQNADPVALPTNQSGVIGQWAGPGVSANMFNPAGFNGTVALLFWPQPGQCALSASFIIDVTLPTPPAILGVPAQMCQTDPPIALSTVQSGITGNWSGTGVTNNNFDPTGLSGLATLTFTPAPGQCALPATFDLNVSEPVTPAISGVPASFCETGPPVALPTTQGGFTGNWSGPGVAGNVFDPAGQSGNVTLLFTPTTGNCVNPANYTVSVTAPVTPQLGTATLCQTAGPYNLSAIADPNYPAGVWSGPGVIGNNFDPAGQSGTVMLTFTPTAPCTTPSTTTITVNVPAVPQLAQAAVCQNSTPLDLATLADPNYPAGTWIGPGVSGGNFNPAGQSGPVTLTFTPSAPCTQVATTSVTVNPAPTFTGLTETCDLATQTYTVSFTINGGDPATYTVNGNPVGGNTFTSGPLASGANYSFEINDANGCGPVLVSGSANCACATGAGTMDPAGAPLQVCENSDFTVAHNGDENIGPGELLQFVLHDNPGAQLGNIIAVSNSTTFPYPAGVVLGQTYYVSAIAGADDGSGNVDLDDPCLAVSQGVAVVFYFVTATFQNGGDICAEDCFDLQIQLTGIAPFNLEYTITGPGVNIADALIGAPALATLSICPAALGITGGTITVELTGLLDANGCADLFGTTLPSQTLTVLAGPFTNLSPTLCPGESIVVNGTQYDETNPVGTEVFINGSLQGCDSTVTVNLSFLPPAIFNLNQTLCTGGSVTVNGNVYNANNPSGTEIFPNASTNGCDSTVFINLTFNTAVTNNLTPTLCPGGSVTVNNTVYNQANPAGTETFPGGSFLGCDSIVNVSLAFFQTATFNLNQTLCTGGSVTVGGTVYNVNNPSGTEILPNASVNGCDSTVLVNLTFNTAVTENLFQTLCPGGSVTVNNTVYNQANPAGTETFPGGSFLGCDSIVNVSLAFFPPATFNLNQTLCTGGSVTVGGTVYNANNPSGTEILPNASVNGCDSTVLVNLTFNTAVTNNLTQTLCPGGSVTVGGTVYNQANPAGTETFPGGSFLGCDSIVNVSLAFFPPATFNLNQTLCTGGSVTVGSTVYNANNPTGTEILPNASVNGCDSTVFINLTFGGAVTENLTQTLCPGGSITVGGTVYNQANPSGTETFPGGSFLGCDSIVNVSLSFFPPATFNLNQTLCTGGSVTVGGTVYNQANPSGTQTFPGGSFLGCDSIVNVSLTFWPAATFNLAQMLCIGSSITVNGTVYDEANPSGTQILPAAAANGCDSIIMVNLTFGNEVVVDLSPTLCPGESIFINGTLYFSGNTTGSETFSGGSYLGCDSTVNVNLSYFPEAVGFVETTLQPGGSIVVNGTVYNQANPSGVEVFFGGSVHGCDSLVFVELSFEGVITALVSLVSPNCINGDDGSVIVTGITGGTPPYTVALDGANSTVVSNFPLIFNDLDAGFHQLTLQDADGNLSFQELLIPQPPPLLLDLGDDLTIGLGESVTLPVSTSFPVVEWSWSPPDFLNCADCGNPTVQSPTRDITYTLTATDANGCTATGRVTVFVEKVRKVFVPNAFSPNGDGINDLLTVFAGPQVASVKTFKLFDRWGNNLYEFFNLPPNEVGSGWDGTFKGRKMDVGVYVWFAEVEFVDGEVAIFKGDVMLVR